MKVKPQKKITVQDLQRTVNQVERVLSTAEFRDRIRAICGLRPEGYYNPPVEQSPRVHARPAQLESEAAR